MLPEGKVALITGGAMGMGKGFADSLLQAGAKVCIADYNKAAGDETVKELTEKHGDGKIVFVQCDVTSRTDMEAAFKATKETFGGIDIVVNNAGVGGESEDNWERCIDINMKGTMRGTRLGIDYLSKENGGNGGTIINMASAAGLNPNPFSPVYGCTKAGIIHASRCFAFPLVGQLFQSKQSPEYTLNEVAKHHDATSCWIVVSDKVYDVTDFLNEHPGGEEIILENAGTDTTGPYLSKGHSKHADDLLEKYYIGELVKEDRRHKT